MPRYFLNLYNDQTIIDDEGAEFPDLAAAKAHAITSARGVMAEQVALGRPLNLSHRIEVADPSGMVLTTVAFREVVTILER